MTQKFSRREFIRAGLASTAEIALEACGNDAGVMDAQGDERCKTAQFNLVLV